MEFEEVENIGQRIKEIRKSKSITIQKLSQFTDLSVGYLSNLERNQASPTLNNLQRICVALGISIRDLLSPSGEERTLIRQPIRPSFQNKPKDCADRDQCLRAYDTNSAIRFSHENQAVQTLYDEYLKAPLSDRAHHLLHVEEY